MIIDIVTLAVCILFLLMSSRIQKNKPLNPIVLFYMLWSFILFLSVLNLYGLYKPSRETYFFILLMLVCFFVGSLSSRFPMSHIGKKKKAYGFEVAPNFLLFYTLIAVLFAFYLFDVAKVIKFFVEGTPLWQIRNWVLEAYGSDNQLQGGRSLVEEVFRVVVLSPFRMIIPPIAAYVFFAPHFRGRRKMIFILSVIYLMFSSLAGGGGRLGFIYYFGCFFMAYQSVGEKGLFTRLDEKKYRKVIAAVLLVGVLLVGVMTRLRVGPGYFIKQMYHYFALPPTLLGVWLPEMKMSGYTYGLLTFFGLHTYFFRALDILGMDALVPEIYDTAYKYILDAQVFRGTGAGMYNAFVTPIYYFYLDGGYPFVCLASLGFGSIISRFYRKFRRDINIRSFTFYALVMYSVFVTFMGPLTTLPSFWLSFVMAHIVLGKKRCSRYPVQGKGT